MVCCCCRFIQPARDTRISLNVSIVGFLHYSGSKGEGNRGSRSIPNGLILSGSRCNRIFGHYGGLNVVRVLGHYGVGLINGVKEAAQCFRCP